MESWICRIGYNNPSIVQPKKREVGHIRKALAGDPNRGDRGLSLAEAITPSWGVKVFLGMPYSGVHPSVAHFWARSARSSARAARSLSAAAI